MTTTTTTNHLTVHEASEHLMDAIAHQFGVKDISARDPLVQAIVEYGDRERAHDDDGVHRASERIYTELAHYGNPRDLGAHDPFVMALAAYGEACRAAGPKAA